METDLEKVILFMKHIVTKTQSTVVLDSVLGFGYIANIRETFSHRTPREQSLGVLCFI